MILGLSHIADWSHMGKLSEISKTKPKRDYGCSLSDWAEAQDPEDQKALWDMIKDPEWSAAQIAVALKEVGFPGSRYIVSAHRNGECKRCGKRETL
jgi:hypothetical protein